MRFVRSGCRRPQQPEEKTMTDLSRRLQTAADRRQALNEHEAKALIRRYGIPTVAETVVPDAETALTAASGIGFPLVVKALGRTILHKTESGLVHLNLTTPQALAAALEDIRERAGDELEGFLLQPHVPGRRELVTGMFRDPQFGPLVMFGLGGVLTEVLSDVAFRLAPLSTADAQDMLDEIRARDILRPFRGEAAVDRNRLIEILLAVSRVALEREDIAEIDINPLVVTPDGRMQAVDALVRTAEKQPAAKPTLRPVAPDAIRSLFYPRSIAFIGASSTIGKWGHMLITNTIAGGYKGGVHPVNPRGGTIAGRTVYPSISDLPEGVDLAVVTVPAEKVEDLVSELKRKNILNMLLITSGFGEAGPVGRELETDLVAAARKAGILILGPNTMGICNPHIQFYCTGTPVTPRPGSTTMIAQSGNMGVQLLTFAEQQQIGIRGFCGSGNEAMMTIEDYLDGLEIDDLTRTVMLYIESVKNGRRFYEGARKVGKKKPIVLLKGGRSGAGRRAAASHTGALSTDNRIFNAVCRQAGIVEVEQPMELLDLAAGFSSLPLPRGNRVAIMTLGGGWGVITSDLCAEFGLQVPELPPDIIEKLDAVLPPYWSRSNPVDLVGERDPAIPIEVLQTLLDWSGCDGVINLGVFGRRMVVKRFGEMVLKADPACSPETIDSINELLTRFEKDYLQHIVNLMNARRKPIIGVSLLPDEQNQTVYRVGDSEVKGVFFSSPERAVNVFAKMYAYHRFLARHRDDDPDEYG
jgi:acyl-CoA synthetase (NDP forming)